MGLVEFLESLHNVEREPIWEVTTVRNGDEMESENSEIWGNGVFIGKEKDEMEQEKIRHRTKLRRNIDLTYATSTKVRMKKYFLGMHYHDDVEMERNYETQ